MFKGILFIFSILISLNPIYSSWGQNVDLGLSNASFYGENSSSTGGAGKISGVGDVNGDGFNDFLIGSTLNDEFGDNAGQVYLIFGKSSGWTMNTNLSLSDASFYGENSGDQVGTVSGVGDVNNDGYDDFIIGSSNNGEAGSNAGQVYLILGKSSGWSMNTNLSLSDASYLGEGASNQAGFSVSGAGDVNNDGYDDFLIGAIGNAESASSAGQVYLILGKSGGWSMDTILSLADGSYLGETGFDQLGSGLSEAGDVNSDGYDDFLIGTSSGINLGKAYLILGKSGGWSMDTSVSLANASFYGETSSENVGRSLSGVGDVNGDGFDDFLIGDSQNNEGGSNFGQTYLILGKSSGWSMNTNLSLSNASFIGETSQDYSGGTISDIGDFNLDGFDDFVIGASGALASSNGKAYLILGKSSGWSMDTSLSSADSSFLGEVSFDSASAVSGVGDINGDGSGDFLIGSSSNDEFGTNSGQVYLIFGNWSNPYIAPITNSQNSLSSVFPFGGFLFSILILFSFLLFN